MNDAIKATRVRHADHRSEQRAAHRHGSDGARHAPGRAGPARRPLDPDPERRPAQCDSAARADRDRLLFDGPSFCPIRTDDARRIRCARTITAVIPGPERGPVLVDGEPATDMITTLAADSSFDTVHAALVRGRRPKHHGGAVRGLRRRGAARRRPASHGPPHLRHSRLWTRQHPARRSDHADEGQRERAGAGVQRRPARSVFFAADDSLKLNQTQRRPTGRPFELRAHGADRHADTPPRARRRRRPATS